MSRTKKIVASKSMRYGTRMLQAGDTFDAKERDARLLIAIGRAKLAPDEPAPVVQPPTPAQVDAIRSVVEPSIPLIEALRNEYRERTGAEPPKQWGIPKLTKEVSDLRNAV